jgi:hypothetical protein
MGRFFTNVHVRASERSSDARAAIVAVLESRAAADGLHAVGPAESFDRLVAIGLASGSPWIAVADEATESQDVSTLEDLAKRLSRTIHGHAVSVLVHDSDVLDLRLFENGRRLDHFVNQPDYSSDRALSAKAREALQGNARAWAPLLKDGASVEALEQAFRSTPLFAEETLAAVAQLLGFGEGYDLGANDLRQDTSPGFELRYFARPATTSTLAGTPPAFAAGAWTPSLTLSVGEPLRWALSVVNQGGPANGIAVRVSGTAIERGLVRIASATCALSRANDDVERTTAELNAKDGRVEFPAVKVPSFDASRAMFVALEGSAAAEGGGALDVRVEPLGVAGRALSQSVGLSIGPALPRPLKATDALAAQALRDLQTPATLVAVVALRWPRDLAANQSSGAFAGWIDVIAGGKKAAFSTTVYDVGRPRSGRFSSKDLAKGAAWRELCETMATSGGVYAQTRVDLKAPDATDAVLRPTHGFAFHVSHLPHDVASLSPHLAFWFDVRGKRADEIDRVRTALVTIVDNLVRTGQVYQAFLACWNWRPAFSLHATPYELACGVHGQCTTRHTWAARFLHAVAQTIWLGAPLVGRLSGFQAPDGSEVDDLNGSWRVTCRDSQAVSALERALAALLPTADDWKNEVLSGRK